MKLPTLTVTSGTPAKRISSIDQLSAVNRTKPVRLRFRIINPKPGTTGGGDVALTYEGATGYSDMIIPAGFAIEYELTWPPRVGDPTWSFESTGEPKYPALFSDPSTPDVLVGLEVL
jgi:hypothetical protein